jgi:NAD(P)-dependent dehydrogenase (short-subunit alcohol dehydrogenase family)
VTGAGSGIGRAVTRALLEAGYRVALAGRREEALHDTLAELGGSSSYALVVPADVTDPNDVGRLFTQASDRFGRLDLFFNNAGVFGTPAPLDEISHEEWLNVVNVNLTGAFLCAQAAFRTMRHQAPSGGRIINNGSLSAHVARPHATAYTATKHGVTGLTKAISLEGRPYRIACGQIDVGNAATDMTVAFESGVLQPDGSLAREPTMAAEHVGDAVLYMAGLPLEANVQFLTVLATGMPSFIGRG